MASVKREGETCGIDYSFFAGITYEDFRERARDPELSRNEKIGFPESYREGFDDAIAAHIAHRLPAFGERARLILDIGCGCSGLADRVIAMAENGAHTLLMADSQEMLALLPESAVVRKMPGLFPGRSADFAPYLGKVDAILVYSVLQHVVLKDSLYGFLDEAATLLAPGGAMLLGDIPNTSKRERLFASAAGQAFHRSFTGTDTEPPHAPLTLKAHAIDDGILFGILQRYRNAGFESYLLPQPDTLPQWNRREDIVIARW